MPRFHLAARLASPTFRFVAALALFLVVALPSVAQRDVSSRLSRVTGALSVTPDQQQRLDAVAARYATQAPGDDWRLAADVAAVLTPQQIEQLRAAGETRRGERAAGRSGRAGERRGRGMRPGRDGEGARTGRGERAGLTDAQREQMRTMRQAHRSEMEALVARFRSGSLTDAAFVSERDALRARHRASADAALSPEQRQRRATMEQRRAAAEQARAQALGLTDAQQRAFEALRLEQLRTSPARTDRAARPSDADREAMGARRSEMRTRAEQILTPEQRAVVAVHRALGGMRGHAMRGERGPRAGERGDRRRPGRAADR